MAIRLGEYKLNMGTIKGAGRLIYLNERSDQMLGNGIGSHRSKICSMPFFGGSIKSSEVKELSS